MINNTNESDPESLSFVFDIHHSDRGSKKFISVLIVREPLVVNLTLNVITN